MTLELQVEKREEVGSKKLGAVRSAGYIPGVIYGKKDESTPIKVNLADFRRMFREAGESTVITLKGLDADKDVLIHDVAFEPVKNVPEHVDFYAIDKDAKVTVSVPLEFVGVAPAVKELGGVLVKVMHEIEIEALPKDLPHEIEVDISLLKDFDAQVQISDLKFPQGVEATDNAEEVIALVNEAVEESFEEAAEGPDMDSITVEEKGKKEEAEEE